MNLWPVLPILIPLLMMAALLIVPERRTRVPVFVNTFGTGVLLAATITLWVQVWRSGTLVLQVGDWPAPFGISLVADLFGVSMTLITALMGFLVSLYILGEESPAAPTGRRYFIAFQAVLMGVCGAFLTGDLFNLYVWFEVMLMSSFVLMTYEGKRAQLEGGLKYTVLNLIASVFFLSAIGLLYGATGTLNLAHLAVRLGEGASTVTVQAAYALLLIAFGLKAGVFPLFSWLPASYHTPRVATSALLAGLLTKVGVYALLRVHTLIFSETLTFGRPLLMSIACLTMVTGVLGAASHFDIRRILSFHIISQIGYMVLGLALFTRVAIAAAVFYVFHHIVVKTNLFLIGGIVQQARGTQELRSLGGLARQLPFVSLLFLIPALSLAGMPPLSGFFAKLTLIRSGIAIGDFVPVGIALLVGILTLFSMMKIWMYGFWMPLNEEAPALQPVRKMSLVPVIIMALITVSIGVYPRFLYSAADRIARELMTPGTYVDSVMGETR